METCFRRCKLRRLVWNREASEGPQEKQNCSADGGHREVLEEWKVPEEGARGYEKASEFFEVNYCGEWWTHWTLNGAEYEQKSGLAVLGTLKMSLSDCLTEIR